MILASPEMFSELVKNVGKSLKPFSLVTALQSEGAKFRESMAMFETLKKFGYTEEEILEVEDIMIEEKEAK